MKKEYPLPTYKVSYRDFVIWQRELGIMDPEEEEAINSYSFDICNGKWFLVAVNLSEEDYIAFKIKFGI